MTQNLPPVPPQAPAETPVLKDPPPPTKADKLARFMEKMDEEMGR